MSIQFVPEKNYDWKTKDTLREFCTIQEWQHENGRPFNRSVKRRWLADMNDNQQSDIAGLTFQPGSNLIELWYTTYMPFVEKGVWVVIPGINEFIKQMERNEE